MKNIPYLKQTFAWMLMSLLLSAQSSLAQASEAQSAPIAQVQYIAKIRGGQLLQDKEKGIMAFWPPENPAHGRIGQAVLVTPGSVVGFAEDQLNFLMLVKVQPGTPFTYQAGACWSRTPEFPSFEAWKAYLDKQERP